MPDHRPDIPNSRYFARAISVATTGWLADVAPIGDPWAPGTLLLPVLAMLLFVYLDRQMLRPHSRQAERMATDVGQLFVTLTPLLGPALVLDLITSWHWPVTWFVLAATALLLLELFNNQVAMWQPTPPKVLIAGDCPHSDEFADRLAYPATRLPREQAIACLNDEQFRSRVDEVVIIDPSLADRELEGLLDAVRQRSLRLNYPSINDRTLPRLSALATAQKRLFDIFCAAVLLSCCAPLMLLMAVLIRLQDGGPALFRQQRLGLDGRCMTILKFRSMQVTAGDDPLAPQARNCDPRITPLGHWMRYWGIDELPQLLNVLYGDMSMVGPRPHAVAHDLQHGALIADYALRRAAKPGITGLAQVRGMRGETRISSDMAQRIDADLEYIARQSLRLDLLILLATPKALLRSGYRHETLLASCEDSEHASQQPGFSVVSETTYPDAVPHADSHCEDSKAESA